MDRESRKKAGGVSDPWVGVFGVEVAALAIDPRGGEVARVGAILARPSEWQQMPESADPRWVGIRYGPLILGLSLNLAVGLADAPDVSVGAEMIGSFVAG